MPGAVPGILSASCYFFRLTFNVRDREINPIGLTWGEEYTTPEGWIGSGDFEFTAEDWVIGMSYPIVPPERTIYQVTVTNQITGF